MSSRSTVPISVARLPVRTLAIDVLSGPDAGRHFAASGNVVTVGTAETNDLVLGDATVSRFHVELSAREDRVFVRDIGSTNGTEIGGLLIERGSVAAGTILKLGNTTIRVGEGTPGDVEVSEEDSLGSLKGRALSMRLLISRVLRIARVDASVLIVGESGSGKELVARALHDAGSRAKKPFVVVDCGSLASGLIASELFGHEKGAFTGADRKHIGAFERAQGGTLFLDEIGELAPSLQTALLGVLERRRFRRVGGTDDIVVDVRVLSATHRDLRSEVNAKTFRLDLYYRLAVARLEVPPLRERCEDIPLLIEHFLREVGYGGSIDGVISKRSMESLCQHRWPGNVRELRNFVESTLAMGELQTLDGSSCDPTFLSSPDPRRGWAGSSYRDARAGILKEFEMQFLSELLRHAKGNVSLAARLAQMDRSHLIELLHRHELK